MTRVWRLVLGALTIALLTLLITGPARAATLSTPLIAATGAQLDTTQPWQTCKPRAWAARPGAVRIYADIFAGMPGRLCIKSTGYNLTITNEVSPNASHDVTAAPAIQYGVWYTIRDKPAGFPLLVSWIDHRVMTSWFRCPHWAPGSWACDATDTWFSNSESGATEHGAAELVIIARNAAGYSPHIGNLVRLAGHWWWASMHITGSCGTKLGCWPLLIYREARQSGGWQRIRHPAFMRYAVARGWIRGSDWLDSANAMIECWSGCKGVTIDAPPIQHTRPAVIKKLAATS